MVQPNQNDQAARNNPPQSRWQALRERVEKLVYQLPDGSVVDSILFRDMGDVEPPPKWMGRRTLQKRADRIDMLSFIDAGQPDDRGATPLIETMTKAVRKAAEITGEDSAIRREIAILVYTDGEDTSARDPAKACEQLATEFAKLVEINENVWLYYTPFGEGKPIGTLLDHPQAVEVGFKYPLPLTVEGKTFVLPSAARNPDAVLTPFLCGRESVWPFLTNQQMRFVFEPDPMPGANDPERIATDPAIRRSGRYPVGGNPNPHSHRQRKRSGSRPGVLRASSDRVSRSKRL